MVTNEGQIRAIATHGRWLTCRKLADGQTLLPNVVSTINRRSLEVRGKVAVENVTASLCGEYLGLRRVRDGRFSPRED